MGAMFFAALSQVALLGGENLARKTLTFVHQKVTLWIKTFQVQLRALHSRHLRAKADSIPRLT
jgi:hypothetical protein